MTRPKKKSAAPKPAPNGSSGNIYPEGVPLDANGIPIEGAEIPLSVAKKVALDKTSARTQQMHHEIIRRKASGEVKVKWHPEERVKFPEVKLIHPSSMISIEQIAPFEDKSIATRPLEMFKTYDDMLEFVKATHWNGQAATYKWVVGDTQNPTWAQGTFSFGALRDQEEEDMARQNQYAQQPPQQQPPQQPPQWQWTAGGWWHPNAGYAPQVGGAPPSLPWQWTASGWWHPQAGYAPPSGGPGPQPQPQPQVQQPPQPPQPVPVQVAPAPQPFPQPVIVQSPAPQGASPDIVAQLVTALAQSQQQVAALSGAQHAPHPAQSQPQAAQQAIALPDGSYYHPQIGIYRMVGQQPAAAPTTAPAAPEPPKPRNAADELQDTFKQLRTMLQFGRAISAEFNPRRDADEDDEPANAIPAAEMPLKVQEVGPVRYVTDKHDQPVDATTQFMFNFDKIADFGKEALKQAREIIEKRREAVSAQASAELDPREAAEERALSRGERLIALKKEEMALRGLGQQPQHAPSQHAPPPPPQYAQPTPPPQPTSPVAAQTMPVMPTVPAAQFRHPFQAAAASPPPPPPPPVQGPDQDDEADPEDFEDQVEPEEDAQEDGAEGMETDPAPEPLEEPTPG